MLKLAPCIEMMFSHVDFYDRFKAAKDSGVDYVDFWSWSNKDIGKIKSACEQNNIKVASCCIDTINPDVASVFNKKKLLTRDADAFDAFFKASQESIKTANEIGAKLLIITVGQERNDVTRYEQHANIVMMLKRVAPLFEDSGITLIVEPLNVLHDHIGYFLASSYEAFEICNEVGSPNVKVLYDVYHQQITEGNLIPTIRKYYDLIGHFHIADVPGRHEPGTGEINYRNVLRAIAELGCEKYIGLEYSPVEDSAKTVRAVLDLCK